MREGVRDSELQSSNIIGNKGIEERLLYYIIGNERGSEGL